MGCPVVRDSTIRSHQETVDRVITAMRSQIDQPLCLESMARIGFASRFHFHRTFRQITGIPPRQFLYALRLDAARRLLMHSRQKVIDICYGVGYNSVGTFTRRFTNVLGVSPTAFREITQSQQLAAAKESTHPVASRRRRRTGYTVQGQIEVPDDFHGVILIGLFATAIPQAKPLACTIVSEAGSYQIKDAPEGESYLFALGLEDPIHAPVCFRYESALRGGGNPIRISCHEVHGQADLRLRPPSSFDPPILMALTLLIDQFFGDGDSGKRGGAAPLPRVSAQKVKDAYPMPVA